MTPLQRQASAIVAKYVRAWDLFVDGFWIDTVSRPADMSAEEVKRSLPDEYPRLTVAKPASRRNNRKRSAKK